MLLKGTVALAFVVGLAHFSEACSCLISDEDKPVCGSDGQIYPNLCQLRCVNMLIEPAVTVKDMEYCLKNHCSCTKEYQPVCGSDMKTYGNECLFNCKSKEQPDLVIIRIGPCQ